MAVANTPIHFTYVYGDRYLIEQGEADTADTIRFYTKEEAAKVRGVLQQWADLQHWLKYAHKADDA